MALGKAVINISANLAPLRRGLISAKAAVVSSMAAIGRSVTSMAKNLVGGAFRIISSGLRKLISLAKLAAIALLGIGIASVKISVDAEETENLFVESMGGMLNATRAWVTEYSKARGLFENDTKKMVATLFLMLSSMGLAKDEAFEMAKGFTALAGDMASFRNIRIEEAFQKLQAGITGEAEPLKRLGILIGENFLKTTKLGKAIKKTGGEYTELQKIQLRYAAVMEQTTKDQGDLLRTINSTANVLRTMGSLFKITGSTIGDVFKPAVTEVAIVMRDWLMESQDQIKGWAETIRDKVKMVIDLFKDLRTVIAGQGDPTTLAGLQQGGRFERAEKNLTAAFKSAFEIAKTAIRSIYEFVSGALEKLKPIAASIGEAIGEGITKAIFGIGGKIISRIKSPLADAQLAKRDVVRAMTRTAETEETLRRRTDGTVDPVTLVAERKGFARSLLELSPLFNLLILALNSNTRQLVRIEGEEGL